MATTSIMNINYNPTRSLWSGVATAFFLFCNVTPSLGNPSIFNSEKTSSPLHSKESTKKRLEKTPISVEYNFNDDLYQEIRDYTELARRRTERTLGRSMLYFPIFEEYLNKYDLPQDLKALAVIESALNPTVKSSVGAAGLWQFMPSTARSYGLIIDDYVDERYDPYKSTEAAVKYLAYLHDVFEDWTLAVSAYNCGKGRVNQAIRKANSRQYDKVKKYLPKETQQYVVKYVAANYMLEYYLFYDLHPQFLDYTYTVTEQVKIKEFTTFHKISKERGVSIAALEYLNPSYVTGKIPANRKGNIVTIPLLEQTDGVKKVLAKQNSY